LEACILNQNEKRRNTGKFVCMRIKYFLMYLPKTQVLDDSASPWKENSMQKSSIQQIQRLQKQMNLQQAVYTESVFYYSIMGSVGGGVWTAYTLIYKHVAASLLLWPCQTFHHCIFRLFSHTSCTVKMAFHSIMSIVKKLVFCCNRSSSLKNTF